MASAQRAPNNIEPSFKRDESCMMSLPEDRLFDGYGVNMFRA
jgi:hypothetical protein